MTLTTGTRSRPPCSSTAPSTATRANSSRRLAATDGSSCWIERTARASSARPTSHARTGRLGVRRQGPADTESRERTAARWRAGESRIRAARRTGRRPRSNPDTGLLLRINATDACEASTTSTTRKISRKAGAATTAADFQNRSWRSRLPRRASRKRTHPWIGGVTFTAAYRTAGNLLFTTGPSQDVVALNATTGQALWHSVHWQRCQQFADHL